MRLGIVGAGRVGTALGRGLARAGHAVVYGVRAPAEQRHDELRRGASVSSVRDAAERADVVVLATPWPGTEAALAAAGDLGGRVLIDATNPIGPGFTLTHGHTDSGGEQVARWAQGARVVKAFNTTGFENLAEPGYGAARAAMLLCGDDDDACQVALGLARDLGLDAVHAGRLAEARLLEPMAMLWIKLAMVSGHGRDLAFGLLRR